DVDYSTASAVRNTQAGVGHLFCYFSEDRLKHFFFRAQGAGFFRCQLGDEYIARIDVASDFSDTTLVEVLEILAGNVRYRGGQGFRTAEGLVAADLMFLDFDVGQSTGLNKTAADNGRIFEVVPVPGKESDEEVATESQFAIVDSRTIGD